MTLGLSLLDSVSIKTAAFSCLLQWQGLLSWHIAITTHDLHAQRRFFIGPQTKIIKVLSSQLWYRLDFFDWKACSSENLKHSARVQIDWKMERLQRLSSHLRAQPVASAEVPWGASSDLLHLIQGPGSIINHQPFLFWMVECMIIGAGKHCLLASALWKRDSRLLIVDRIVDQHGLTGGDWEAFLTWLENATCPVFVLYYITFWWYGGIP